MNTYSLSERISGVITQRIPVKPAPLRLGAPLASFSFDDFPRSAWSAGGPILERWGVKATYFTSGRYCGAQEGGIDYYDLDDLRAVAAAGHEIGCHGFGHLHGPRISSEDLLADFEANAAFLRDALGEGGSPLTHAYPYGKASPRTKALSARRFAACRGIYSGINRGWTDLAQLWAAPLEARSWRADKVERLVADVAKGGGWLIFYSHDVSENPTPYGCTPAMLEHALQSLAAAGIGALPLAQVLAVAAVAEAA